MKGSPSVWNALSAGPIAEPGALPPALRRAAGAFLHHLQSLLARRAYALAVSGGPDSMGLLALAAAAQSLRGAPRFAVLHVNHGLAAEAAHWAEQVGRAAQAGGLAAQILHWRGQKPQRGLAAAARQARYDLLRAASAARGLDALVLAHHREDQAETVLLRLARGSQLSGLAAMAPARCHGGLFLLRPFLRWRPADLHQAAKQHPATRGYAAADSANRDLRFARARLRAARPALSAAGLTPARLARLADAMRRVRALWDAQAEDARRRLCRQEACGLVRIARAGFEALPPPLAQHLLRACLRAPCPRRARDFYPPRTRQLAALWQALRAARQPAFSLAGFLLRLRARDILLYREPAALRHLPPLRLRAGARALWDGRFWVSPRAQGEIAALGADGLRQARALGARRSPWPQTALMSCPGLWQNGRLRASTLNAPPHDLPHGLVFAEHNPYL